MTHPHIFSRFCKKFAKIFLLVLTFAAINPVEAATGSWRSVKLTIASDRKTASVTVPEGMTRISLQKLQRPGGWKTVTSQAGVSGGYTFNLNSTSKKISWRVLGWYVGATPSRAKFPTTFYKGKNKFAPVNSPSASSLASSRGAYFDALPALVSGAVAENPVADVPTVEPVEADIWKVDGNTVYFFNQLRGLQVLDLSTPSDPRLAASLRLPAVGEDLYLMPSNGGDRTVLLLTGNSFGPQATTRINQVKIADGKAEIVFSQDVPGRVMDSRLVGDRLILATHDWNAPARLTQWIISESQTPQAAGETIIEGMSPLISAGSDWLAVATHPIGQWNVSDVSVFAIRSSGLIPMAQAVRTEGSISNKFRVQWANNVLTTISENRSAETGWIPKTIVENFRAWSPDSVHPEVVEDRVLGRLELEEAHGESLYATRFAGNKAYVVTFLQTDPLWVIDLSNPQLPSVAGSVEVPGWSSYLQPMGDLLFSIGLEDGKVNASLFDVSVPSAPSLASRVYMGEPWAYSEAIWNEKALKLISSAGLAMVPMSQSYWNSNGASIQLLDIDLEAKELRLRGKIPHAFDARRADMVGNSVVSISQRVMEVANIENRDAPVVTSETSLAWPVDRVIEAGEYLFQIEDGRSFGNSRATLRFSPAMASEQILSEVDLGDGTIKIAEYRDSKLYVLRQIGSSSPWLYWARFMGDSGTQATQLILDVYEVNTTPSLTLLGTCSMNPKSGAQLASDHFLWPQANRPAVPISYQFAYGFGPYPIDDIISVASPQVASLRVSSPLAISYLPKPYTSKPYWVPEDAPQLLVFDVSQPTAPTAGALVNIGPSGSILTDAREAAGGLVVMGVTQWRDTSGQWLDSSKAAHSVAVIKISPVGTPLVRPAIDLPGEPFGITELDANGFLAFTRTIDEKGQKSIQVSACDGFDAFQINSLAEPADSLSVVANRSLFTTNSLGVDRYTLDNLGRFTAGSALSVGWKPDRLRWSNNTLIGSKWGSFFAAATSDNVAKTWNFNSWSFALDQVIVAANGDLVVPFGAFGADRYHR